MVEKEVRYVINELVEKEVRYVINELAEKEVSYIQVKEGDDPREAQDREGDRRGLEGG